ncbi:hypothetical protein [Rhizobium binae]|uniref:hypothetical protein n=1 Tax=Rhizobium binae TaxID=1138190 RepID=UPI003DAA20FA
MISALMPGVAAQGRLVVLKGPFGGVVRTANAFQKDAVRWRQVSVVLTMEKNDASE